MRPPVTVRAVTATDALPGDVLLTRYDGWTGRLIRFGAALRELLFNIPSPNLHNHCILVHHFDAKGVLWGIEARAEGVGWIDLTQRVRSKWTVSNAAQPKTVAQRARVCELGQALLGTPYDWTAIALDGFASVGISPEWEALRLDDEFPEGGALPYAVVCSAYVDWCYEEAGLANPGGAEVTRYTQPTDWDQFVLTRGWETTPAA